MGDQEMASAEVAQRDSNSLYSNDCDDGASSRRPSHRRMLRFSKVDEPVEEDEYEEEDEEDLSPQLSGIRLQAYKICIHPFFNRFILGCIAANCIAMACDDPLDDDENSLRNSILRYIDYVLLVVFTVEMLLKMTAYCLFRYFLKTKFDEKRRVNVVFPHSWNCLDFTVVLAGFLSFVPGVGNFAILRLLRTLRPLRTLGKIKGMRVVIKVIIATLRPLFNVFMLSCMVFFVFGICGVQLFQGNMAHHCFSNSTGVWELQHYRFCGDYYSCPVGQTCMVGKWSGYDDAGFGPAGNPNAGVTSFDNIGHAFLTIFVAITLEGWVDVMYMLQDSYGYVVPTLFFVSLILFGSLFVLNLALAVITDKYDEYLNDVMCEEEEDEEELEKDVQPEKKDDTCLGSVYRMAVSSTFNNFIFVCILANTVTLAMEHKRTCVKAGVEQACEMETAVSDFLRISNYIFIAVFTVECIIKVVGLGPMGYVQDRFNMFDATVVVLSYFELVLSGNSSFSALRCFRLARIFKMAKQWESLRAVLETILDTLPSMGYLSILLFLFMFIATVAGMQLFGGKMQSERANFNNFGIGMLTVFQMLTGENWNEVLYDGVHSTNYWCVLYFLVVVVVGNFIVLNLFLAILLSNFGSITPPDMSPQAILRALCACASSTKVSAEEEEDTVDPEDDLEELCGVSDGKHTRIIISEICVQEEEKRIAHDKVISESGLFGPVDPYNPLVLEGNSLFLLSPENPVRVAIAGFVDTVLFEWVILVAILLSSLSLAADGPTLDSDGDLAKFLNATNWFFTILFCIELILKVIVYGFMFTPQAYMKSNWNILDALIVIISIVSLTGDHGPVHSFRTLRALRPLRTIKRAPGIKIVVNALIACMPSFINIFIVSLVFYLVFAIMAVQFWAGKFWACRTTNLDGDQVYATHVIVGNQTIAVSGVGDCSGLSSYGTAVEWSNADMTFDNVCVAMLTLFEVASLELWLDVLYNAMDVPKSIGQQPVVHDSAESALFFVVFIVVGSFLIMNLFVGAVVDNFNREKENVTSGAVLMTSEQEEFIDQLRVMINNKPGPRPQMPQGEGVWVWLRRQCFKIVLWDVSGKRTGRSFDAAVCWIIALNVLNMSVYYWLPPASIRPYNKHDRAQEDTTVHKVLEYLNFLFTWIFIAEFVVKHLALGVHQYWRDWWNRVDGAVVLFSLVGFTIEAVVASFADVDVRILHVFRATRVIRIVRLLKSDWGKGALRLLETLAYTLPSLGNVSALLVLVLFIYTTLGMSFFGELPTRSEDDPVAYAKYPYQMYNEHANFKHFHIGMLTLFRMSTGESWNGIMHDCMAVYPAAWIFFVSYMMIVSYIMFNLLIAVVLEQFCCAIKQDSSPVKPDHLYQFAIEWARFDPECTHTMSAKDLAVLLKRLPPPLGLKSGTSPVVALSDTLHIPTHKGQVHFVETATALIRYAYDVEAEDEALTMSQNLGNWMNPEHKRPLPLITMSGSISHYFPTLLEFKDDDQFLQTYAAMRMQATLRGHYARGVTVPEKKEHKTAHIGATGNVPDSENAKWGEPRSKPHLTPESDKKVEDEKVEESDIKKSVDEKANEPNKDKSDLD